MANSNYVSHDTTNTADSTQPTSTNATHSTGSDGWTQRQWKDFNGDYQARNSDNTIRTPGTYQARNSNNTTRTPAAYQRHDKDNSSISLVLPKILVGSPYDDEGASNSGAVYVYDLDGTGETKIVPSDAADNDYLARWIIAVGNNKIVIGSSYDDDNGSSSGSAYVYDLDGTNELKLTASDASASDSYGRAVAIGNNKIAVGSPFDDVGAPNSGSVYVYNLDGTGEIKINASDRATGDYFGIALDIGNDKIVVGAYGENFTTGSVYVYDLDGTNEVKIAPSDGASSDRFGYSVAVGDNKIVVGAYFDDDNGSSSGSVYVYDIDGTNELKITASDAAAGDQFGHSVAVGNNKIVVGALNDDDDGSASGSVYVYDLDGTNELKITASDAAADDKFGHAVAVGHNKIIVGSLRDDDGFANSGSAYIYNLDGTGEIKIKASDASAGANYGSSVAIG